MDKLSFINTVKPYAEKVQKDTGINADYVVAHWAHETGYGSNTGFKQNNLSGYMAYSGSPYGINGKSFSSLNDFVSAYENLLTSNRYKDVKNATSVTDFAKILSAGGYAQDTDYAYAPTWQEASTLASGSTYEYMTEDGTVITDTGVIDEINKGKTSKPTLGSFGNILSPIFDFLKVGFANVVLFILLILFVYFSLVRNSSIDNIAKKVI
jgi:hypothetical protein